MPSTRKSVVDSPPLRVGRTDEAQAYTLELIRENQARVLAGTGSPKILIGGINHADGPNFHTLPMIAMGASVVSIGTEPGHVLRPDRLICPPQMHIQAVLKRMPPKWKPDFFWDPQAEHGHYFPVGLGDLDLPKLASFVHAHLGQALIHLRGMFDCLLAPSASMAHMGDRVEPWGLSWGMPTERIRGLVGDDPGGERDVDVSCTINPSTLGEECVRGEVVAAVEKFKAAHPELRVEITHGLKFSEFFSLLRRSKVSINVGAWGSPLTYRAMEIVECEAALVHVDETAYGSLANLEEHWPGTLPFAKATPKTLASVLLGALSWWTPENVLFQREIWRRRYSYEEQYRRLFDLAGSISPKKGYTTKDWSRRAYAVNFLTGFKDLAEPHRWALTQDDVDGSRIYKDRDWDVCLWRPTGEEKIARWRTDLARGEDRHEVYRRYS